MNRAAPILALLAATLVAACQPQDPDGKAAPPPADAPDPRAPSSNLDIGKPITARGTEPFWALTIDGTAFKLTRPDRPDLTAEAPGAAMKPGQATWIAKGTGGEQLTVTLYASECSDGMSDLKYPMTAEVVLPNESLRGCAAKTAELPREGG